MTNADAIREMTDNELYDFLQAFEVGDIDYSLTFCSLCKEDAQLDCDECFKRWLFADADDYNGLLKDKGINSGYKTESDSENPNNSLDKDTNVRNKEPRTLADVYPYYACGDCINNPRNTPKVCGKCVRQEDGKPSMYEPKTKPKSNILLDAMAKAFGVEDEPQTDCAWRGECDEDNTR